MSNSNLSSKQVVVVGAVAVQFQCKANCVGCCQAMELWRRKKQSRAVVLYRYRTMAVRNVVSESIPTNSQGVRDTTRFAIFVLP